MKNNVFLFGFSGSGKSTIANLISKRYGLRVIHPSGIIRDLLAGKRVNTSKTKFNRGFWESKKGVELFKSRLDKKKPVDVISDQILLKEVDKGNVVIDTWNLPWLTSNGVRIYLKAGLKNRAKRVAHRSGKLTEKQAKEIVDMKDEETRKLFKRIYGFDIKKDHGVFDLTIDTNNLDKTQVFKNICEFLDLTLS